ncbi:MAG TPA: ferritin-like protein [Beijerinckiaceae bacterium]|jgi:rubrerythrin
MLKLRPEFLDEVRAAETPEDLYKHLQAAIELEHATIPLYLTAAYSIKDGYNAKARGIIVSVAIEEMLHMTIAANVLNAIGGSPTIDKPGFVPLYPGPLPMHVHEGLTASLQKATRGLIYNTFMTIEEPEVPIKLRVKQLEVLPTALFAGAPSPTGYATIGDFYAAIQQKIRDLAKKEDIFNPSNPQVVDNTWFPASELFPVVDVDTACKAIDVIVEQGEGTKSSPLEHPGGEPAHYYRLAQIVYGRELVEDESTDEGYSYSGAAVPLDPAGVWNLLPDAKAVDYAEGSRARYLADRFNYAYTSLLRALHRTFNGEPERLRSALGLMYELRLLCADLVATPIEDTPYFAAPTFEYTPTL